MPKGQFVGPNTLGARLFRTQMAILGTFMVFGGTTAAPVFSLLSLFTAASARLKLVAKMIGVILGVFAAIRVRREVETGLRMSALPPHVLWP